MFKGKVSLTLVALLVLSFFITSGIYAQTGASASVPPAWTYNSVNALLKHGLASNYFASEVTQSNIETRYQMAYLLKDIIERARKIYNTKDYAQQGLISYNDALTLSYLVYEFRGELGRWKCDTAFITDMCYALYYPKAKAPKTDFFYANVQSVYINNITDGLGARWAYDYYNVRGFVGDHSNTNKINLGVEVYSKDFKQSFGLELSEYNKSGNDILSAGYGIMPPAKNVLPSKGSPLWIYDSRSDTLGSPRTNLYQVNKLWYNDYKRKFSLMVGPFSTLYTNALTFTNRQSAYMFGPANLPLNGAHLSGKTGEFWYELFGGIRYASDGVSILWAPNAVLRPFYSNSLPYNQITQGFSAGSDKCLTPFLKKLFAPLKSAVWNFNYIYTYDKTKDNYYPNYAMIIPLEWEAGFLGAGYGRNMSAGRIGPQSQTVFGGNLYLSNFVKNLDFSFLGGRSIYNPVHTITQNTNGYAYDASFTGNFKPFTACLGYRYVNARYAPLMSTDTYALEAIHNPLLATFNSFQMYDTDTYPNNNKGIYGWASYEFKNKSVLTLLGHNRSQIISSYFLNRIQPGFVDQKYPVILSPNFQNTLASENELKLKYYLPYKKWTFNFTGDLTTMNRDSTGFNPLNQDAKFVIADATYKLTNDLTLKGGYYKYGTKGFDPSASNRAFYQTMPTLGAYYKISDGTGVNLLCRWYDYVDKFNANNNYTAKQILTEFNWRF